MEFFYNSYLQPEIMHDEQESEKNIAQQLDHLFIVLTGLICSGAEVTNLSIDCFCSKTLLHHYQIKPQPALATFAGKNCMQSGGLTFAKAKMADGIVHTPSPQIKPAAMAGVNMSDFFLFILSQ